jgi:hypothetical protein
LPRGPNFAEIPLYALDKVGVVGKVSKFFAPAIIAGVGTVVALLPSHAVADAMHGFCTAPTPTCTDNGSITPVSDSSPNFGFRASPDSGTVDDFDLVVLIPNSVAGAFAETVNVTGTHTGVTLPVNLSLVSATAWNSGQLDAYLGIGASPTNPIGAFLPLTQNVQPTATGYAVYSANFGSVTFGATTDPQFTTLFDFPTGTIITAYAGTKHCTQKKVDNVWTWVCSAETWNATANSGSLIVTAKAPEPASLTLLGAGLFGLGFARRRKAA